MFLVCGVFFYFIILLKFVVLKMVIVLFFNFWVEALTMRWGLSILWGGGGLGFD